VKADSKLTVEQILGPVLSVITVSSVAQAIKIANSSDDGLNASVFSANGQRTVHAIRADTITCYGEGDLTSPFGGYKQSGFGGRDKRQRTHDKYPELNTIGMDLSDPANGDTVL